MSRCTWTNVLLVWRITATLINIPHLRTRGTVKGLRAVTLNEAIYELSLSLNNIHPNKLGNATCSCHFSSFLYSVNLTEYVAMKLKVCVCVCFCVCVCVSVCVWQRYSPNGWMDFDEISYKWSDRYLRGKFFSDFEISKLMMSLRPFCTFIFGALSWSQFCFDFLQNW